jgi:hypothetical protein
MSQDSGLREEFFRRESAVLPPCRSGMQKFHIDAYGMLQLCSSNRQQGYDLRQGSFKIGFYEHLPSFGCARKVPEPLTVLHPTVGHG